MNIWEKITEAQTNKQSQIKFRENGQEVHVVLIQNGWYEGYVSMS
jgi:hypothetical protein